MMLPNRSYLTLILLTLAVLCGGCMQRRVVSSTWDQWRDMDWYDASNANPSNGSSDGGRSGRGFAIELGRFTGADAHGNVFSLISDARQEAGLANLWYTTVGGATTVYAGRFRQRDSNEAKAMLRQVHSAKVNGDTPFEDAKVVALSGSRGEVLDPNDLRTHKGKGLYTLQIGYYDGSYGPDFRRAAEAAAKVLREQGEEGYYYHGPNRSMVLVNAWEHGEAFTLQGRVDRYSDAVRALQQKYSHNIPNGRSFTADDDPAYVESQRSFLVPIR